MRPILILAIAAGLLASPSQAALLKRGPATPAVSEAGLQEIRRAIDEQRLLDAGRMLDEALVAGADDPRLLLLNGDLNVAKGRYNAALSAYRSAQSAPSTAAQGVSGEGVTLALLNRNDEALPVLKKAVGMDPKAWRAWNALGSLYDAQADWDNANAAYVHAAEASNNAAIVLNNRGYSRLLQHRRDEAVDDFVAALKKRPDLAEARTNLRLALAMGGDYDRAVAGGDPADQAALLNNAGFAAGMRGDYAKAEDLLGRALALRSEYYARASENLKIVKALAAQDKDGDARR